MIMKNRSYKKFKFVIFLPILILFIFLSFEGLIRLHHLLKYQTSVRGISKYNKLIYNAYEQQDFEKVNQSIDDRSKVRFEPHPFLLYRPVPNQKFSMVNINSFGFRGKDKDIEVNNEDYYRVFLLGGSAAYGCGALCDEKTIAGYIQKMIYEKWPDKKIIVVNAAIDGYTSNQERILFEEYLIDYADMVIVFDGLNDIFAPTIFGMEGIGYPYEFIKYKDIIKNPLIYSISKFFKKSMFYEKFSRRITTIKDRLNKSSKFNFNEDKIIEAMKNNYFKNLRIINDLSKKRDIDAFFFLQPMLLVESKNLSPTELQIHNQEINWGYKINNAENYFRKAYFSIVNDFDSLFNEGVHIYSLKDVFAYKDETIYVDIAHYGDKGQKIVAEAIFETIVPVLEKK